jgi:hypothetical protein
LGSAAAPASAKSCSCVRSKVASADSLP